LEGIIAAETGKGSYRGNIRPTSIPSTSTSETFLSTVFAASLTTSAGPLRATNEVEKARGAKLALARLAEKRVVVRVRNDILDIVDLKNWGYC